VQDLYTDTNHNYHFAQNHDAHLTVTTAPAICKSRTSQRSGPYSEFADMRPVAVALSLSSAHTPQHTQSAKMAQSTWCESHAVAQ
jgi:hypothetical protein